MSTDTKIEGTQEAIERAAREAFKDHVVTPLSRPDDYARAWKCAKPGTGTYGFRVVVWPGYLTIQGDIGGLTLCRCEDMISWCRRSVRDPSYFFSKVADPGSRKLQEYSQAEFLRWLEYSIEADQESGDGEPRFWTEKRIRSAKDLADGFRDSALRDLHDFLDHEGYPDAWESVESWEDWSPHCYWSLEAVKCFLRLLDTQPKPADATDGVAA